MRVFAREFFYNFKAVQKITSGLSPENMGGKNFLSHKPHDASGHETDS